MAQFKTKYSTRQRIRTEFTDMPSETNQQWKDETDINYIIKNCSSDSLSYNLQIANSQLAFGEMVDAGQQLNILYEHTKQREQFNSLPSDIRKEFGYDFKEFLKQSSTQKGLDKLVDLGLLNKCYRSDYKEPVSNYPEGTEPISSKESVDEKIQSM